MTKKIAKAIIMQRLINRFALQRGEQQEFELDEKLIPVTIVDDLVRTPKIDTASKNLTAASGQTTIFTVPANKRWIVRQIYKAATTGNSVVYITNDTFTRQCPIILSGTAEVTLQMGSQCRLEPGWAIRANNTNDAADSAIIFFVIYDEEDVYSY